MDVRDRKSGRVLLRRARWCASFSTRLRGLMFRGPLAAGEALILVEARDSRASAAIHMFGVAFPIAAVWIDDGGRIVDKVLALPWRPYYAPRAPARYILETRPDFLERVSIGDEVDFEEPSHAVAAPRRAAPGAD
ncbi:MAG: DUF192 domain-containing protein [Anaerolineales bacterium]